MNELTNKKPLRLLPYGVGAVLVVLFLALCAWQVDRGLGKRAEQRAFASQAGFASWSDGMAVRPFQKLKASGDFDARRQFLLENIIVNSRNGYYVITPLELRQNEPVLLVNRGWLEKTGPDFDPTTIDIDANRTTVRGRAGSLPRAGYRMGDAITPSSDWPRRAVYPTLGDISVALGREVQPFVLLLDPEDEFGFYRDWAPGEMGPGRHFGYALQWLFMGIVLAALLIWNYRKQGLET